MGKRLIITEEEKTHIRESYNLNLINSNINLKFVLEEMEKSDLPNKIKNAFDENPQQFVNNLIDSLPNLLPIKNEIKNTIINLSKLGNTKKIIIGLLILISTFTSCVQSGENTKACKTKVEEVKDEFPFDFGFTGDGIKKFYKNFMTNNTDWNFNNIKKSKAETNMVDSFMGFVKNGGLNNTHFKVESVSEVNGKGLIHLQFGAEFKSNLPIHFDIFGTLPLDQALNIKEGDYVNFKFKSIKQIFDKPTHDLIYSSVPNISTFNPSTENEYGYGTKPKLNKEYPDLSLGIYKAQIEK